jgi:inorganic pyrophosphatase
MNTPNLLNLETWDSETGALNSIIETPKGSRNKFKYNPEQRLFFLNRVLPRGIVYPFSFGFIPSTLGEDGDPLDVLVLLDDPVPAGCKVRVRLIGVIDVEQTEKSEKFRNDRLIAIAQESEENRNIGELKDLSPRLLDEIEHFFISSTELAGKQVKPRARRGPRHAEALVKQGMQRFAAKRTFAAKQSSQNGKQKTSNS